MSHCCVASEYSECWEPSNFPRRDNCVVRSLKQFPNNRRARRWLKRAATCSLEERHFHSPCYFCASEANPHRRDTSLQISQITHIDLKAQLQSNAYWCLSSFQERIESLSRGGYSDGSVWLSLMLYYSKIWFCHHEISLTFLMTFLLQWITKAGCFEDRIWWLKSDLFYLFNEFQM